MRTPATWNGGSIGELMQPSTWNDTNQHWIPQFLLKGFGIKGKASSVYQLDKQTKRIAICKVSGVASKTRLLTERDDQLMREIETHAATAIDAIRKGRLNRIDENSRQTLDRLVSTIMLIDPHGGSSAEESRERVLTEGVSELSEAVKRSGGIPDETYFRNFLGQSLGHNWLSGFMGSRSNWITISLGLMGLRVYSTANGEFFIIGDSPVLVTPNAMNGKTDLMNQSAKVILPISSDCMLVYAWTTDTNVIDSGGALDKLQIRSLNSDYYRWTKSRYIYGRNEEVVRRPRMLTMAGRPLERASAVTYGWYMMQHLQYFMRRYREVHDATRARASEYAAREFVERSIAHSDCTAQM